MIKRNESQRVTTIKTQQQLSGGWRNHSPQLTEWRLQTDGRAADWPPDCHTLRPPFTSRCVDLFIFGFPHNRGSRGTAEERGRHNMMAAAALLCVRVTARDRTPQACCRMPGMAPGSQRHESPTLNKQPCSCPRPWPLSRCRAKMVQRRGRGGGGRGGTEALRRLQTLQGRRMIPCGLFYTVAWSFANYIMWCIEKYAKYQFKRNKVYK